ncbi:hypothetical protein AGMMS49546_36730 [Spirochaetia bacterium]|nr:hypothetical protein AGMMS49546_36730 [Spirochaetia bacterium]
MTIKALAEDIEPHFSVIADFISKNSEKIKDVFTQVLLYCSELGLIKKEARAVVKEQRKRHIERINKKIE